MVSILQLCMLMWLHNYLEVVVVLAKEVFLVEKILFHEEVVIEEVEVKASPLVGGSSPSCVGNPIVFLIGVFIDLIEPFSVI